VLAVNNEIPGPHFHTEDGVTSGAEERFAHRTVKGSRRRYSQLGRQPKPFAGTIPQTTPCNRLAGYCTAINQDAIASTLTGH
jgi:hypothetical protein